MSSLFNRTSVRKFTDQLIEREKLVRILKAGMQAPTARNLQPWEFLVVTERKALDALSEMSIYATPLKTATAAIIVLGNMDCANNDSPWWVQDLSACTENILLQITEENLGGVWMGCYPDIQRVKLVSDYFKLPKNITAFSVIALGYPLNKPTPQDKYKEKKIHYEKY